MPLPNDTLPKKARRKLGRVPVAMNGFALGLMGLGTLFDTFGRVFLPSDLAHIMHAVAGVVYIWGSCIGMLFVLKMLTTPRLVATELLLPDTNAAISATPMAICIVAARAFSYGVFAEGPSLALCVFGALLQLANMALFARQSIRFGIAPDSFFFPPTVSIAIFAMTAPATGPAVPIWVLQLSFWSGVLVCAVLLPQVAYRMLADRSVAAGPSAAILQASPSFLALAWFGLAAHRAEYCTGASSFAFGVAPASASAALSVASLSCPHPALAGWSAPAWVEPALGDAIYALSVSFVLLTIGCCVVRREAIRQSWFSPAWAAWTFPTASSANAAVLFYAAASAPGGPSVPAAVLTLAYAYAVAMFVLASFIVLGCNIMVLCTLRAWLTRPAVLVRDERVLSTASLVGGGIGGGSGGAAAGFRRLHEHSFLNADEQERGAGARAPPPMLEARLAGGGEINEGVSRWDGGWGWHGDDGDDARTGPGRSLLISRLQYIEAMGEVPISLGFNRLPRRLRAEEQRILSETGFGANRARGGPYGNLRSLNRSSHSWLRVVRTGSDSESTVVTRMFMPQAKAPLLQGDLLGGDAAEDAVVSSSPSSSVPASAARAVAPPRRFHSAVQRRLSASMPNNNAGGIAGNMFGAFAEGEEEEHDDEEQEEVVSVATRR